VGAARLDEAERRVERLLHQDGTTETVESEPRSRTEPPRTSTGREKENEAP
jgi:hypothetical protein